MACAMCRGEEAFPALPCHHAVDLELCLQANIEVGVVVLLE